MAREGLRVLVVSKKSLTEEQYQDFEVSKRAFVGVIYMDLSDRSLFWGPTLG